MTTSTELPVALDAERQTMDTPQAGRLSYYADTSHAGRPLVLIHSINAAPSAFEMKPLFDHYRSTRPVYAPDLPGFGASDRGDRAYTPELYAKVLSEFLTSGVGERADVVAFSLSSEFAARAVALAGPYFASLALISPTGFGHRSPPTGNASDRLHRLFRLPVFGGGLYKLLTSRLSIRYFLGLAFEGPLPPGMLDYAYVTSHQPGAKHAPFHFLSFKLFTPDALTSLYAPLELPVLVLYDRDPNITFDRLPGFLEQHPNWCARRIEPSLGLPHWEQPERTNQALDEFWAASTR
jgi:pimeloyl-ACP methyl ester carboxylesterase